MLTERSNRGPSVRHNLSGSGARSYVPGWQDWPWAASVQTGSIEVLTGAGASDSRSLLLCYPDEGSELAADAAEAYHGDTLVFVGEPRGGCCGTARFFDMMDGPGWKLTATRALRHFEGINDEVAIWTKVNSVKAAAPGSNIALHR